MLYDENVKQARYYSVENGYIFRVSEAIDGKMKCISEDEEHTEYAEELITK